MRLSEPDYKRVARILHGRGMKFTIQIFDVQSLLDSEKENSHKRSLSTFYSQYHRLDEVSFLPFLLYSLLIIDPEGPRQF